MPLQITNCESGVCSLEGITHEVELQVRLCGGEVVRWIEGGGAAADKCSAQSCCCPCKLPSFQPHACHLRYPSRPMHDPHPPPLRSPPPPSLLRLPSVPLQIHADPYCPVDRKEHFQWFYFRVSNCAQVRRVPVSCLFAPMACRFAFPDRP